MELTQLCVQAGGGEAGSRRGGRDAPVSWQPEAAAALEPHKQLQPGGGWLAAEQVAPSACAAGAALVARVVGSQLCVAGGREWVAYRVVVGALPGPQHAVMRRYRHFEGLHRALKEGASGLVREAGAVLPPKRLMAPRDECFVERRREELDRCACERGVAAQRCCTPRRSYGHCWLGSALVCTSSILPPVPTLTLVPPPLPGLPPGTWPPCCRSRAWHTARP